MDHLMGPQEVAAKLGVSRQRLYQLLAAYADFPEPTARLRNGPVWDTADIERWIGDHPQRRAGRRPRSGDA